MMDNQMRHADSAGCIFCGKHGEHICYVDGPALTEVAEPVAHTAHPAALLGAAFIYGLVLGGLAMKLWI